MESDELRDYSELQDDGLEPAPTWPERIHAALLRPLAPALFGIVLVGLLALLYLSEVAGVEAANTQLRTLRDQQARLDRQEAQPPAQLGGVTSPAYIQQPARALGPVPAPGPPLLIVRGPNRS